MIITKTSSAPEEPLVRLPVMLTAAERKQVRKAAKKAGQTPGEWARAALTKAATPAKP